MSLPVSVGYAELKRIYGELRFTSALLVLQSLPGVKTSKYGRGWRLTIDRNCPEAMIHVLYWATFHDQSTNRRSRRKTPSMLVKYLGFNLAQSLRRKYIDGA